MGEPKQVDVLGMTTGIVSSFVSNNTVPASDLPELIRSVHDAISTLSEGLVLILYIRIPSTKFAHFLRSDHTRGKTTDTPRDCTRFRRDCTRLKDTKPHPTRLTRTVLHTVARTESELSGEIYGEKY